MTAVTLPPEGYYQKPEKKCVDKFCSDSSSDCGSSSGSVRASRGSWGSWSSTSSSDGDKKPVVDAQHFMPAGESLAEPQALSVALPLPPVYPVHTVSICLQECRGQMGQWP